MSGMKVCGYPGFNSTPNPSCGYILLNWPRQLYRITDTNLKISRQPVDTVVKRSFVSYSEALDDSSQLRRLSLCNLVPVVGASRAPDTGAWAVIGRVDGHPDKTHDPHRP